MYSRMLDLETLKVALGFLAWLGIVVLLYINTDNLDGRQVRKAEARGKFNIWVGRFGSVAEEVVTEWLREVRHGHSRN